jgi:hypothetical protein
LTARRVVSDYVATPVTTHASTLALAAGGSATLDSDQVSSGKTGRLLAVRVASSVPFKALLYTVSNGSASASPKAGGFGWLGEWRYDAPARNQVSVAYDASAGLDGFRVAVTNLDPSLPADVHCWFEYCEE